MGFQRLLNNGEKCLNFTQRHMCMHKYVLISFGSDLQNGQYPIFQSNLDLYDAFKAWPYLEYVCSFSLQLLYWDLFWQSTDPKHPCLTWSTERICYESDYDCLSIDAMLLTWFSCLKMTESFLKVFLNQVQPWFNDMCL